MNMTHGIPSTLKNLSYHFILFIPDFALSTRVIDAVGWINIFLDLLLISIIVVIIVEKYMSLDTRIKLRGQWIGTSEATNKGDSLIRRGRNCRISLADFS